MSAAHPPVSINIPWSVTFPDTSAAHGRRSVTLLPGSWTEHPDDFIRHFSGTATYEAALEVPVIDSGQQLWLDLGEVSNIAQVHINDRDLGVLWKPPFTVDISAAIRPGLNRVVIQVTNTWVNRLIGEASRPEQQRTLASGKTMFGMPLTPGTKLLPAGLVGPITLRIRSRIYVPGSRTG